MIDESTIYWITRLDNIRTFVIVLLCLAGLLELFAVFSAAGASERKAISDAEKKEKKEEETICAVIGVISFVAIFILGLALVFTPTTKEMCAIKVIPAVANCEQVQSLGSDVVNLARSWMNELKPENARPSDGRVLPNVEISPKPKTRIVND